MNMEQRKKKDQEELDQIYKEAEARSHKWYEDQKWDEVVEEETPSEPSNFKRGRTIEDSKKSAELSPITMKMMDKKKPSPTNSEEIKQYRKLKLKKAGVTFKEDKRKMTDGKVKQIKSVKGKKLRIKSKPDTNNTKLKLWMH